MRVTTFFPSGLLAVFAAVAGFASIGHAQVVTLTEKLGDSGGFDFSTIPDPSSSDLLEGQLPVFQDGSAHSASASPAVLTNGLTQTGNNDAADSFFFSDSGGGPAVTNGRLLFDLGSVDAITQINTYSWHADSGPTDARAQQVFNVYGATGAEAGFSADPAVADGSPTSFGYTLIGQVNTTSLGLGGQQGSSIQLTGGGVLGNYRYILFDIFPGDGGTSPADATSNTFFGEMDVVGSAAVPEPSACALIGVGAALAGLLRLRRHRLGLS